MAVLELHASEWNRKWQAYLPTRGWICVGALSATLAYVFGII